MCPKKLYVYNIDNVLVQKVSLQTLLHDQTCNRQPVMQQVVNTFITCSLPAQALIIEKPAAKTGYRRNSGQAKYQEENNLAPTDGSEVTVRCVCTLVQSNSTELYVVHSNVEHNTLRGIVHSNRVQNTQCTSLQYVIAQYRAEKTARIIVHIAV